jgi:putative CocE/NonD family hydrolase
MHRLRVTVAAGSIAALAVAALPQSRQPDRRYDWPRPKYEVRIEPDAMVAMRDGVKLATDLYFPVQLQGKLAVILIRTPYDKGRYRTAGHAVPRVLAGQGYIVAVQDTRGRFASEGQYVIQGNDSSDGYDVVDWLAKQPWSNGNIGTIGCSYEGDVQIIQSKLRHPNLKCMIPQSAGSSIGSADNRYYFFGARKGGNVEVASGLGWFANNGNKDRTKPAANLPEDRFRRFWSTLPLAGMVQRAGGPPSDWDDVASRELTDPWWDQGGYLKGDEKFDVAALHINSWYDFGVYETLLELNLLTTNAVSDRARNNQFAVISPTSHCRSETGTTANTIVGERELGDAQFDYFTLYLQWFDYWLRGVENGVNRRPKLMLYVMGRNMWRAENEWPLARTQFTKYYFHSDGHADSRWGTGTLGVSAPKSEPSDRYTYDPRTPVPSRGGPLCCTGTPDAPEGSFDQSDVEARDDVLVYTTAELKDGVEVTGPIKAVLHVSSSAKDTDFTVKLVDVYPDGRAFNVQEGILRARHRRGFTSKVWMKPGEVYELTVDLEATSNYFGPGHRIRVEVSSSNFPRFDRNLNTGGNNYDETKWVVAENQIHHAASRASYILLPVIPESRLR